MQPSSNHVVQSLPIDIHEVPFYVKFQHMALLAVIIRTRTDMMFKTLDAEQCTFSFTAGITVIYEGRLEYRHQPVVEQMMYYTVAEGCGEDLAKHRITDDETHTSPYAIPSGNDFVI